jgi:hypothetical protein
MEIKYHLTQKILARKVSATKSDKEKKFKELYGRFPTNSELVQFIKNWSKY